MRPKIMFTFVVVSLVVASLLAAPGQLHAATELSIVATSRAPFNAMQQWALALGKLRNVQVRSGSDPLAEPDLKRTGDSIRITGVIDARNQLVVPGKRFSIRQMSALQRWIDEQKNAKSKLATGNDRFGLTKRDVERTHDRLKAIVTSSTKGKTVRDVIATAAKSAKLPLKFDLAATQPISKSKVPDEWQDFSAGTVIAAALRPLELVIVPRSVGGRVELFVTKDTVKESWPVGWKSKIKPDELIPKYFESLPIDIEKTPIEDVTTAIEQRLETPIRYDRALLGVLEMHPESTLVSYTSDRAMYVRILKIGLFRAGMKHEIRVDERGKPFLWVSPLRLPKGIAR